ncbi:hypothetical protein OG2516_13464 [Oceanicola granulosus HTCC2516]|uniref:DUF3072 domain-containing protein n=1 Tax=Oceanicola granulosus (strain ATCC BAA-861 / DSM 15982 / KCTC 12143 / HTCC2516) TaxID=314256 RepID=Q2CGX5_OCEGH|nr:DUF3072 domain-containing protein [Oceanicola granulosus]EAR52036.1 hypothetical protein OG2516_13464 [Oceanicola granulosus HTCC2516]
MMPPVKTVLDSPAAESDHDPDAPMTNDQAVHLRSLCEATGEEFDTALTEAQAHARILELEAQKHDQPDARKEG